MKPDWTLFWFVIIMDTVGECLKCFECESTENPACGMYFKAYQYEPSACTKGEAKCGLQLQPKTADGHSHILRACYYLGQLQGLNESDGCHFVTVADTVTFEFCLCSDDLCNTSSVSVSNVISVMFCASLIFIYRYLHT